MKSWGMLFLFSLAFASCTYHLRGTGKTKTQITAHAVAVSAKTLHSPMALAVIAALKQRGMQALPQDEAPLVLVLLKENTHETFTTVSQNTHIREMELFASVTYQFTTPKDKPITPVETLIVKSPLILNRNQFLSSQAESEKVLKHLRQQLANQLMDKLASDPIKNALQREIYETHT